VRWSELEHAKSVEEDKFPAWKNLYSRKHKEGTSLEDFAKIYRNCDVYQCPNGHSFLIGECRLPMQVGRCPECGESIGGRHHAMLNTNTRKGDLGRYVWQQNKGQGLEMLESVLGPSEGRGGGGGGGMESNFFGNLHPFGGMQTIEEDEAAGDEEWDNLDDESDWDRRGARRSMEVDDSREGYEEIKEPTPEPPGYLTCPLSHMLYTDPVSTPHGRVYDRPEIEKWLEKKKTDPIAGLPLSVEELEPVPETKQACERWYRKNRRRRAKREEKKESGGEAKPPVAVQRDEPNAANEDLDIGSEANPQDEEEGPLFDDPAEPSAFADAMKDGDSFMV